MSFFNSCYLKLIIINKRTIIQIIIIILFLIFLKKQSIQMNLLNKSMKNLLSYKINNPQRKYSYNMVYSPYPGYYDMN